MKVSFDLKHKFYKLSNLLGGLKDFEIRAIRYKLYAEEKKYKKFLLHPLYFTVAP